MDVVCSFWVHRPDDFPRASPYLEMLKILDASCKRFGFEHIVLTDKSTEGQLSGIKSFMANLPLSLMKATTESQAQWLESPESEGHNTTFVGADCIIRQDFRRHLPRCDLAVAYMKGHKKWRINNGFMYVPAESRERVAPIFRQIADDTDEAMCDDMLAVERALVPMPPDYGVEERQGIKVAFVPMKYWNRGGSAIHPRNPCKSAYIMHFMGGWGDGKAQMFEWAKNNGFAA